MIKEIKEQIHHLMVRAARTIIREMPILSSIVDGINEWIQSIDYKHIKSLSTEDRKAYEQKKIKELQAGIKERSK